MKTVEIRPQPKKTDLLSAIGETLRGARNERGLTLRQVAEGAHVSISYLAEIERVFLAPFDLGQIRDGDVSPSATCLRVSPRSLRAPLSVSPIAEQVRLVKELAGGLPLARNGV